MSWGARTCAAAVRTPPRPPPSRPRPPASSPTSVLPPAFTPRFSLALAGSLTKESNLPAVSCSGRHEGWAPERLPQLSVQSDEPYDHTIDKRVSLDWTGGGTREKEVLLDIELLILIFG